MIIFIIFIQKQELEMMKISYENKINELEFKITQLYKIIKTKEEDGKIN